VRPSSGAASNGVFECLRFYWGPAEVTTLLRPRRARSGSLITDNFSFAVALWVFGMFNDAYSDLKNLS